MSEQFQQGDRKIVKESENRYHIHFYDGTKWQDRWHMDQEGASNFLYDVNAGNTALEPIGTDKHGNPILRLKK